MNVQENSDRAVRVAVALGVGVAIAALGIWAQNDALVGVNYDDGIYALLARSVANGRGYVLAHLPDSVPGIKYPPVYPLSLVPFWALAGSQEVALHAMKLANGLYIGLAAGLFAFLLADLGILSLTLAGAVALVGFASGSMMLVTSGLLTEPLYLLLLALVLWASDSVKANDRVWRFLVVGTLAGLVPLTRMVGIALTAAALTGVWRRCGTRRALVVAAAAAATLLPWIVFTLANGSRVPDVLVPRYGSYAQLYIASLAGDPLSALGIMVTNLGAILQTLGARVSPLPGAEAQSIVGMLLIALALLGSRRVFALAPATATYTWFYLAVISVWSFPPFRFVFILFPLLLALSTVSFLEIADRAAIGLGPLAAMAQRRRRWLRKGVLAAGIAVAALMAYGQARALARRVWDGAELQKSEQSLEVIDWVMEVMEPEAVIAFELDPLLGLYTGRTTVPNNYEPVHSWYRRGTAPVEPLARLLREMGVKYLAVRQGVQAAAAPIDALLARYPTSLDLVYVTRSGVLVFRADPAALAQDDASRPGASRERDATKAGESGYERSHDRP